MVIINNEEFKKLNINFLREHPEQHTKWFEAILPERSRDMWFLRVLPPIKKDSNVLDLCGGYGMFGAYLQSVKKISFDYTCLDQNKHRTDCIPEYFRTFGLNEPKWVLHDAHKPLPFPSNSFDMVWLFGWCSGTFNSNELFKEVYRVLNLHGLFLFDMAYSMQYKTRYTKEGLFTLLDEERFTVIRFDIIDSADFGVVASKRRQKENDGI